MSTPPTEPAHSAEGGAPERTVFVVRRWPTLTDSWSEHRGKTFDEAVEWVKAKIADEKASLSYDVVEVEVRRQATVSARIEAIEVTPPAAHQEATDADA